MLETMAENPVRHIISREVYFPNHIVFVHVKRTLVQKYVEKTQQFIKILSIIDAVRSDYL